jgi:hypothetical protein
MLTFAVPHEPAVGVANMLVQVNDALVEVAIAILALGVENVAVFQPDILRGLDEGHGEWDRSNGCGVLEMITATTCRGLVERFICSTYCTMMRLDGLDTQPPQYSCTVCV